MLDNFIIISLIVLSFIAGLKISDRYHEQMNPQPVSRRRTVLGREFYDKLKTDGKAVQQLTAPSPN